MITSLDWYFTIIFFTGILGLVVAGLLFFAHKAESFPARLLAGFLAATSLVALNNAFMATSIFLKAPHLWRAISFVSFCTPAFSFLYVRAVLERQFQFRRQDAWFFLPALLYILSMVPFYILSAEEKLAIITQIVADNSLIGREPESMLPAGVSFMSRIVLGLAAAAGQFMLLHRWKKGIMDGPRAHPENRDMFRWLFLFTTLVAIMFVLLFVVGLFNLTHFIKLWGLVIFTIAGTILFICISLLARPAILYGLRGFAPEPKAPADEASNISPVAATADETGRKTSLTPEQGLAYRQALEQHFREKHPFRKNGYKLRDLSDELGIPVYQLSAFINQEYGKNFNELVNDYRVDYLTNLLKQQKEQFAHFTLEALGKQAGFNSRNAFIASVKRKTGLTPSEYFELRES